MMYMKCPTCKHMLGHLQVTYDKQLYDIVNNPKLSDQEKSLSIILHLQKVNTIKPFYLSTMN